MSVDPDLIVMSSEFNAFKNNGVHRHEFDFFVSSTGSVQTKSFTFTLADDTDFVQLFVYGTDYAKYFRYLDSQYHDKWQPVEQSLDYLVFNHPVSSLYYYKVNYKIVNNVVTVYLTVNGFGSFNFTPGMKVPIAFVEYTLAR